MKNEINAVRENFSDSLLFSEHLAPVPAEKRTWNLWNLSSRSRIKKNYNRFDFLYLLDSADMTDNLSKLILKINDFFITDKNL